jgi:aspartate/methionine/tyrosine aminotransferase
MHPLAQELNQQLEGTSALNLLSDFGHYIYFPKGIVAQAAEAATQATRYDATVGMAVEEREPMVLPCIRGQVPSLSAREMTAYAPTAGFLPLREAWKAQMLAKNPDLSADGCSLPMVVPGLTNGIFQASELFINPGDQVIIPDMCWDNYELVIGARRQATIRNFDLFDQAGGFNLQGLESLVDAICRQEGHRKLVLLLNFPNNPTGYSPSKSETAAICEMLRLRAEAGTDILVICDDAYFGLNFETETFSQSLFTPLATCHPRILAVKVDGSTKEDYVWGFRLGFMTFGGKGLGQKHYQALQSKLTGSIRASVSSSSSLAQNIMRHAYADPAYAAEKAAAFGKLEARYRKVKAIITAYLAQDAAAPERRPLEPLPFNSGYFMAFRCQGVGADELRLALLGRGIGTIAFHDRYLRVAYSAVDLDQLDDLYAAIFETARQLAASRTRAS